MEHHEFSPRTFNALCNGLPNIIFKKRNQIEMWEARRNAGGHIYLKEQYKQECEFCEQEAKKIFSLRGIAENLTISEIKSMRGIGKKALKEILEALSKYNIKIEDRPITQNQYAIPVE